MNYMCEIWDTHRVWIIFVKYWEHTGYEIYLWNIGHTQDTEYIVKYWAHTGYELYMWNMGHTQGMNYICEIWGTHRVWNISVEYWHTQGTKYICEILHTGCRIYLWNMGHTQGTEYICEIFETCGGHSYGVQDKNYPLKKYEKHKRGSTQRESLATQKLNILKWVPKPA